MTTLYIGIAGIIGALCRYGLSILANPTNDGTFPWGTLTCNLLGSFVLGYLAFAIFKKMSERMRTAVTTGLIGSFTTFSTFSWETVQFMQEGYYGLAFLYVSLSIGGGLLLCLLGIHLAQGSRYKEDSSHE
ncbi:fluoride efflux transporter CrcB [Paenibacillus sp. KN14-4R]|uniref:fluoride efflux transporter CrcB n=1 Tax=Paenibacillus sp. KN14-4R TaxID=3445773 RepID=UPI003FA03156